MAERMTYQTNNPVGSVDVRDLYDNAQNLDNFSNGPLDAYPDRFGVSRQSLQGIRNASQYVDIGPYAAGLVFTSRNQVFSYLGEFYAPGPSIVLPYTTTGVGAGEIANFRSVGDAVLRQDLANGTDPAKGSALVGYRGRTVAAKLDEALSLADFGAVGDGVTDDTIAIKAARDAGFPVRLEHGKTYAISEKIAATGHGQGFICDGLATFKMLTGPGQFDRSSYAGTNFDSNAIGIYCEGFNNYTVRGVAITMQPNAGVRTCSAFGLRNSRGSHVSLEAYGFAETADGVVQLDSLTDCEVSANVHDCGTSKNTLPSMQISAVNIDDERIGGIATTNSLIRGHGKNVVLTGAALATYGAQTDGVTVAGTGNNYGLRVVSQFENVGEAFDCFGSFVHADVQAKTCGAYGVKLIHGAQHCVVNAIIDGTAGAAVVFGGSNMATQDVAYNRVTCTASNVGTVTSPIALNKAAVQFDGPSATYKPRDNYVSIVIESGASMLYAVLIEVGANNVVEYTASGQQTLLQAYIAATAGTGNKIKRINADDGNYVDGRYYSGHFTNASITTPVTLSANTLYAVPFRVEGLMRPSRIGVHVQTGAAGSARLGIYRWVEGAPGDLIIDCGTISTAAVGDFEVSINAGAGITLTDGMYALAMVSDSAPAVYGSSNGFGSLVGIAGITAPGVADTQISKAFTYGALPASFGAVTYAAALVPSLWMRTG